MAKKTIYVADQAPVKTINGESINGSGNISTVQTTVSGNAGTATKLQTPRKINGVDFDGSADITISAGSGSGGTQEFSKGDFLMSSNTTAPSGFIDFHDKTALTAAGFPTNLTMGTAGGFFRVEAKYDNLYSVIDFSEYCGGTIYSAHCIGRWAVNSIDSYIFLVFTSNLYAVGAVSVNSYTLAGSLASNGTPIVIKPHTKLKTETTLPTGLPYANTNSWRENNTSATTGFFIFPLVLTDGIWVFDRVNFTFTKITTTGATPYNLRNVVKFPGQTNYHIFSTDTTSTGACKVYSFNPTTYAITALATAPVTTTDSPRYNESFCGTYYTGVYKAILMGLGTNQTKAYTFDPVTNTFGTTTPNGSTIQDCPIGMRVGMSLNESSSGSLYATNMIGFAENGGGAYQSYAMYLDMSTGTWKDAGFSTPRNIWAGNNLASIGNYQSAHVTSGLGSCGVYVTSTKYKNNIARYVKG